MSKMINRVGFYRKVTVKYTYLEKNLDHRVGMQRIAKKKSTHLSEYKLSKGGRTKMWLYKNVPTLVVQNWH